MIKGEESNRRRDWGHRRRCHRRRPHCSQRLAALGSHERARAHRCQISCSASCAQRLSKKKSCSHSVSVSAFTSFPSSTYKYVRTCAAGSSCRNESTKRRRALGVVSACGSQSGGSPCTLNLGNPEEERKQQRVRQRAQVEQATSSSVFCRGGCGGTGGRRQQLRQGPGGQQLGRQPAEAAVLPRFQLVTYFSPSCRR